jgi:transcriptional regulator with XRE-family HTH domain
MTTFQKNLKAARKRLGYTQEIASSKIGVPRSRLGSWEEGRGTPDMEALEAVCKVYKIEDVGEFLFGEWKVDKAALINVKYSKLSKPLKNLVDVLFDNPKLLE